MHIYIYINYKLAIRRGHICIYEYMSLSVSIERYMYMYCIYTYIHVYKHSLKMTGECLKTSPVITTFNFIRVCINTSIALSHLFDQLAIRL